MREQWTSRVASKLQGDRYFYHPDHLGSTNYITNASGAIHEHNLEFPFGETWVHQATDTEEKIKPVNYRFTGKELDSETGLYYYGARYYDPRTSVWQSPDPILDEYMEGDPNGGIFHSFNLNLYAYTYQNPIIYTDPSGMAAYEDNISFIHEMEKSKEYDKEKIDSKGNLTRYKYTNKKTGETAGYSIRDLTNLSDIFYNSDMEYEGTRYDWSMSGNPDIDPFDLIPGTAVVKSLGKGLIKLGKVAFKKYFTKGIFKRIAKASKVAAQFCFVKGTKIKAKSGFKNIEDIKKGDYVWAFNLKTKKNELQKVLITTKKVTNVIVVLKVQNDIIETTPDHPFWVKNKGWVEAENLKKNDLLRDFNGKSLKIKDIRFKKRLVDVYNFEVEKNHNYYVSINNILVHNNDCFYLPNSRWINRNIFNQLRQAGFSDSFAKAMKKGWATSSSNSSGIKFIGKTEKGAPVGYTHKIKVTGKGKNWRVYGKIDERGNLVFDRLVRGAHD